MTVIAGPLLRRETWLAVVYLAVAAPLGVLTLLLVLAGLGLGLITAVAGIGLPLLAGTLLLAREVADVDRRLVNRLLGGQIPEPGTGGHPAEVSGSGLRRLVAGARTWRSLAWVALTGVAGLAVVAATAAGALAIAALLAVPFVDGYLSWGQTWRSSAGPFSLWTLPVALACAIAVVHLVRAAGTFHRRAAMALLGPDQAEQLTALQAEAATLQERALLARDLHDGMGHALSIVVLQAEVGHAALPSDVTAAARTLRMIGETGRRALADLDDLIGALHADDAPPIRPGPDLSALPELLARAGAAGLPVTADVDDPQAAARHPAGGVAYRIVQEACTNALRHAGPVPTVIRISTRSGTLDVEIRSGVGSEANTPRDPLPAGGGRGLAGLAERVRLAGGDWSAGLEPGGVWVVSARLPTPRADHR